MVLKINKRKLLYVLCLMTVAVFSAALASGVKAEKGKDKEYIKWAEMNVPYSALKRTMELDIDTYGKLYHISWIEALSYLAVKNGNNWSSYSNRDVDSMLAELGDLYTVEDLVGGNKYYSYYREIFSAMLAGMIGEYEKEAPDGDKGKKTVKGYGLIAYSPVAEGFYYSHYDDFGNGRSYGYRRQHLGNDLMGYVGTPIISVEGGTVEAIGWNRYGGWRLGIRSFDGRRSYYYAHLRKDSPYAEGIKEGSLVKAGQVIGYMGMTGYSQTENVNGMKQPHLHFGMQLIFDESQKEGTNQIWVDVYNIVKLLYLNRATVTKKDNGHYVRKYDIILKSYPEELQKYLG